MNKLIANGAAAQRYRMNISTLLTGGGKSPLDHGHVMEELKGVQDPVGVRLLADKKRHALLVRSTPTVGAGGITGDEHGFLFLVQKCEGFRAVRISTGRTLREMVSADEVNTFGAGVLAQPMTWWCVGETPVVLQKDDSWAMYTPWKGRAFATLERAEASAWRKVTERYRYEIRQKGKKYLDTLLRGSL